jgi:hypothetical protein
MDEVSVKQMNFGGKPKVGRRKVADKRRSVSVSLKESLFIGTKGLNRSQFFEDCYTSSKNMQQDSYLRKNFGGNQPAIRRAVTTVLANSCLSTSSKVSAVMSILASLHDSSDAVFIVSGP